MHTFVNLLKEETKNLKDENGNAISPTKLLSKAGVSNANWYNWIGGSNNPSKEIQKKVLKTLQTLKGNTVTRHTQPVSAQGEKTINSVIIEKKSNVMKLQQEISFLEALL